MSKALQLARYQTGLMEEGSCSSLNSGSVSTQEEGSSSSLNFGSSSTKEEGSSSSLNLPSSSNEVELEGRKNGGKKAWEKTMVDMAVLSEEKAIGENAETEIVEEKCVRTRLGNYSHEPWLIKIQQKIDLQHKIRELSEQVCIYRVIKPVMIGKPEAYEPVVVSLGPYHHKSNQKLSAMDQHKVEAVSRTLKKLNPSTRDLIEEIRLLDGKIRKCYDEEIEWNADILSRMIQMDACFILEFFICLGFERDMNDVDCFSLVFQNRGRRNKTSYVIEQDIFKLENQIPLFVLVTILERICGDKEDAEWNLAGILAGATAFTGRPFKLVEENKFQEKMWKHITDGAHHLLDLRRRVINDLLTPSCGQSDPTESPYTERSIPPAKLLKKAGIKFKPGHFQFKKRRFGSNVLILPPMSVDENTDTVLRNLMAFEECRRCSWTPEDAVISEYICIINHLIDSEIDVSLLTKEGIITSYLGSDADVAKMFNGVCNGLTETKNEHFEVAMNKAKEQYYSQLRMWISQFKNEYFSKPWQFVSLAVGILILVMTAAQFAFAVKRNNKSR